MRLSGKRALVTGGTRGIGAAIVSAFLKEGARVVFSGRTMSSVQSARQSLPTGADAVGYAADLAQHEATLDLARFTEQHFAGGSDVLVNNAGIISTVGIEDITAEGWDRVQAVNVRAAFFLCQMLSPAMCAQRCGSIINVSSFAGQHGGVAGSPAYSTSKAALIGLTRSLARRLGGANVRVNAIAPADIETDMTANWPNDLRNRLLDLTPLARFGSPSEVSTVAVFLATDDSSFMTGQTLSVNGGAYFG